MNAGLTRLSDKELTELRERIAQLSRTAKPAQRAVAQDQLEAIDLEWERRISVLPI